MSPLASKLFFFFALVSFSPSFAAPAAEPGLLDGVVSGVTGMVKNPLNLISLLKEAPPALMTKNPSPTCKNVNEGALLCCESTFDGGFPLVVKLSDATGYELTKDTVNGIYCKRSTPGTCTKTELCCQVDAVATTAVQDIVSLALFCRHTPKA